MDWIADQFPGVVIGLSSTLGSLAFKHFNPWYKPLSIPPPILPTAITSTHIFTETANTTVTASASYTSALTSFASKLRILQKASNPEILKSLSPLIIIFALLFAIPTFLLLILRSVRRVKNCHCGHDTNSPIIKAVPLGLPTPPVQAQLPIQVQPPIQVQLLVHVQPPVQIQPLVSGNDAAAPLENSAELPQVANGRLASRMRSTRGAGPNKEQAPAASGSDGGSSPAENLQEETGPSTPHVPSDGIMFGDIPHPGSGGLFGVGPCRSSTTYPTRDSPSCQPVRPRQSSGRILETAWKALEVAWRVHCPSPFPYARPYGPNHSLDRSHTIPNTYLCVTNKSHGTAHRCYKPAPATTTAIVQCKCKCSAVPNKEKEDSTNPPLTNKSPSRLFPTETRATTTSGAPVATGTSQTFTNNISFNIRGNPKIFTSKENAKKVGLDFPDVESLNSGRVLDVYEDSDDDPYALPDRGVRRTQSRKTSPRLQKSQRKRFNGSEIEKEETDGFAHNTYFNNPDFSKMKPNLTRSSHGRNLSTATRFKDENETLFCQCEKTTLMPPCSVCGQITCKQCGKRKSRPGMDKCEACEAPKLGVSPGSKKQAFKEKEKGLDQSSISSGSRARLEMAVPLSTEVTDRRESDYCALGDECRNFVVNHASPLDTCVVWGLTMHIYCRQSLAHQPAEEGCCCYLPSQSEVVEGDPSSKRGSSTTTAADSTSTATQRPITAEANPSLIHDFTKLQGIRKGSTSDGSSNGLTRRTEAVTSIKPQDNQVTQKEEIEAPAIITSQQAPATPVIASPAHTTTIHNSSKKPDPRAIVKRVAELKAWKLAEQEAADDPPASLTSSTGIRVPEELLPRPDLLGGQASTGPRTVGPARPVADFDKNDKEGLTVSNSLQSKEFLSRPTRVAPKSSPIHLTVRLSYKAPSGLPVDLTRPNPTPTGTNPFANYVKGENDESSEASSSENSDESSSGSEQPRPNQQEGRHPEDDEKKGCKSEDEDEEGDDDDNNESGASKMKATNDKDESGKAGEGETDCPGSLDPVENQRPTEHQSARNTKESIGNPSIPGAIQIKTRGEMEKVEPQDTRKEPTTIGPLIPPEILTNPRQRTFSTIEGTYQSPNPSWADLDEDDHDFDPRIDITASLEALEFGGTKQASQEAVKTEPKPQEVTQKGSKESGVDLTYDNNDPSTQTAFGHSHINPSTSIEPESFPSRPSLLEPTTTQRSDDPEQPIIPKVFKLSVPAFTPPPPHPGLESRKAAVASGQPDGNDNIHLPVSPPIVQPIPQTIPPTPSSTSHRPTNARSSSSSAPYALPAAVPAASIAQGSLNDSKWDPQGSKNKSAAFEGQARPDPRPASSLTTRTLDSPEQPTSELSNALGKMPGATRKVPKWQFLVAKGTSEYKSKWDLSEPSIKLESNNPGRSNLGLITSPAPATDAGPSAHGVAEDRSVATPTRTPTPSQPTNATPTSLLPPFVLPAQQLTRDSAAEKPAPEPDNSQPCEAAPDGETMHVDIAQSTDSDSMDVDATLPDTTQAQTLDSGVMEVDPSSLGPSQVPFPAPLQQSIHAQTNPHTPPNQAIFFQQHEPDTSRPRQDAYGPSSSVREVGSHRQRIPRNEYVSRPQSRPQQQEYYNTPNRPPQERSGPVLNPDLSKVNLGVLGPNGQYLPGSYRAGAPPNAARAPAAMRYGQSARSSNNSRRGSPVTNPNPGNHYSPGRRLNAGPGGALAAHRGAEHSLPPGVPSGPRHPYPSTTAHPLQPPTGPRQPIRFLSRLHHGNSHV
ncbi:hypothetical protein E2P81_ATG00611 [Venturia nashicola]|nr:hypothetical protein E2P81_ATG00611 [Venturia nashicola]